MAKWFWGVLVAGMVSSTGSASAGGFDLFIGGGGPVYGPPVVYAPAPVIYSPPPVVYAPPPVVYAPPIYGGGFYHSGFRGHHHGYYGRGWGGHRHHRGRW